jgi:hypothetical protein
MLGKVKESLNVEVAFGIIAAFLCFIPNQNKSIPSS